MDSQQENRLPVTYVRSADQLNECISQLSAAEVFAIDLEFDRDHYTYGFDLCLMQLATQDHCFLVDPKEGVDVQQLFPMLESTTVEKIAHCSGEDLRLLHSLQCYPKNIVDTEIYAKLLNYERTSLSALLQHFFNVELNKKMQKINWTTRPLTEEQLLYAADDVLYLIPLKQILEKQAREKGLLSFIAEENELLSTTIHNNAPKTNFLKQNDLRFLSPHDQFVLNGMFRYRDTLARKFNKPAHHIIREALLRSIALGKEEKPAELEGVHYSLKMADGRRDFFRKLEVLRTEASTRNLDKKKGARSSKNGMGDDAIDREWLEDRKAKFKLVQQAIADKYGEHSMRFIFSSTLISSLLSMQVKISDIKTASRRQIIRDTAKDLQIDLSEFE